MEANKTGELQSLHSYTKPGPRVQAPANVNNVFQFLIFNISAFTNSAPDVNFSLSNGSFSYCPHNLMSSWSSLP